MLQTSRGSPSSALVWWCSPRVEPRGTRERREVSMVWLVRSSPPECRWSSAASGRSTTPRPLSFSPTFHHALRQDRQDPLGALQRSQRADLKDGKMAARAVYRWAAFEVYVVRPQNLDSPDNATTVVRRKEIQCH